MSSPNLTLRPATAADDDALWSILGPVFRAGDTYAVDPDISRADALTYWRPFGWTVLVAEAEEVLGTAKFGPNQAGGGAHVANASFAVSPAARGRGVARFLLDGVLRGAREAGFQAMQFNAVVAENAPAVRVWTQAGFGIVGRVPGAFILPDQRATDLLIMHRVL